MPISLNVNVDKVDKDRFFKGKKGRYMDLVLFETPDSDYGDYMVKQRGEKGEQMPILGNAKVFELRKKTAKKAAPDDENDERPSGKSDPW
jgi:hypothetical protein